VAAGRYRPSDADYWGFLRSPIQDMTTIQFKTFDWLVQLERWLSQRSLTMKDICSKFLTNPDRLGYLTFDQLSDVIAERRLKHIFPAEQDLPEVLQLIDPSYDGMINVFELHKLVVIVKSLRKERTGAGPAILASAHRSNVELPSVHKPDSTGLRVFSWPSFAESLLVVAFMHFEKNGESQAGTPVMAKCTWLLTYLHKQFVDCQPAQPQEIKPGVFETPLGWLHAQHPRLFAADPNLGDVAHAGACGLCGRSCLEVTISNCHRCSAISQLPLRDNLFWALMAPEEIIDPSEAPSEEAPSEHEATDPVPEPRAQSKESVLRQPVRKRNRRTSEG